MNRLKNLMILLLMAVFAVSACAFATTDEKTLPAETDLYANPDYFAEENYGDPYFDPTFGSESWGLEGEMPQEEGTQGASESEKYTY